MISNGGDLCEKREAQGSVGGTFRIELAFQFSPIRMTNIKNGEVYATYSWYPEGEWSFRFVEAFFFFIDGLMTSEVA